MTRVDKKEDYCNRDNIVFYREILLFSKCQSNGSVLSSLLFYFLDTIPHTLLTFFTFIPYNSTIWYAQKHIYKRQKTVTGVLNTEKLIK